jgi:hypothetical protein
MAPALLFIVFVVAPRPDCQLEMPPFISPLSA